MAIFRFDTILQATSGLPRDNVVNTWHFSNDNPTVTDFDNVRDMLRDFFTLNPNVPGAATAGLQSYLAGALVTNTALVRAYNLADPTPRIPVYQSEFTLSGLGGGTPLPSEVALVLSFQGTRVSGEAQAGKRNRKYIGPWAASASSATGRPTSGAMLTMRAAARRMREASAASVNWEWVWYSETTGDSGIIEGGWVDDAWDTQRRRGLSATTRGTWSSTTPA